MGRVEAEEAKEEEDEDLVLAGRKPSSSKEKPKLRARREAMIY